MPLPPWAPTATQSSAAILSTPLASWVPATGELPDGVEAQARQALENLKAVLEAGGMALSDVAKTTVFLADINDFAAINAIYAEYFTGEAPARSCVQVAALPKGALFEIEAVAVK